MGKESAPSEEGDNGGWSKPPAKSEGSTFDLLKHDAAQGGSKEAEEIWLGDDDQSEES